MSASFYDLLKFAKTGIASPEMTAYDKLKALAMCKGGFPVATLTGIPPLTFQSDGTPLTAWSISGNMTQSGTPSSSSPIYPSEMGEKTGNLFDKSQARSTSNVTVTQIENGIHAEGKFYFEVPTDIESGSYYLSWTKQTESGTSAIYMTFVYTDDTVSSSVYSGSFTLEKTVKLIRVYVSTGSSVSVNITNIMLNSGNQALPYEPYGYKIPITCGGNTYNVFTTAPLRKIGPHADYEQLSVGEVRKIRKLVLTGQETWYVWNLQSETLQRFYMIVDVSDASEYTTEGVCSHFRVTHSNSVESMRFSLDRTNRYTQSLFVIERARLSTVDTAGFKAYLAQQYQNGTPVTVWYVLATEQTETVTAPTITPAKGANTLTVGTTLPPSEVSITGHIKSN